MLAENTKEELIRAGEMRLRRFTGNYFMDLSAQIVKDDNPLAQYDLTMLTSEDREKAAPVILKEVCRIITSPCFTDLQG